MAVGAGFNVIVLNKRLGSSPVGFGQGTFARIVQQCRKEKRIDDALVEQLSLIPKFVAACGFQNAKAAGFEADDFLASAAHREEKRGGSVLIASGDRDTFQLASDDTTILYPVRGQGMARIGPAEVRARYGVDPAQVPEFIALRGDPSDKLPGAPGVGATGAASLLERYGSLEAALKGGRFPAHAASLRLYREIATMDRKAPLRLPRNQRPTWKHRCARARMGSQATRRASGRSRSRELRLNLTAPIAWVGST